MLMPLVRKRILFEPFHPALQIPAWIRPTKQCPFSGSWRLSLAGPWMPDFSYPIVFVMVSVNGYVSDVRYSRAPNGEWDRQLLVEGKEPSGVFPCSPLLLRCDWEIIE